VSDANYKKSNMYFLTNNVIITTTKTDIKYTFLQNIISHFMWGSQFSQQTVLSMLFWDVTEHILGDRHQTLEKFAASIFTVEEQRWRTQIPVECWYLCTLPHGMLSKKTYL